MMTARGKGFFNIFVGSMLFINTSKKNVLTIIMGVIIMAAGLLFLFMSLCKKMSDDEVNRAVSVQRNTLQKERERKVMH